MREPFYQRCHACRAWTAPVEREEARCYRCGADPRPPLRRAADGMLVVAFVLGVVLAAPGVLLLGLAVELGDYARTRDGEDDGGRDG